MTTIVQAMKVSKAYGKKQVLKNISLDIPSGQILGLIGPNGAGKTTLLKALLGLCPIQGSIKILGYNPMQSRAKMLEDVCFIADTAILPRWIKVSQLLHYMEGVHPKFNRTKAVDFLSRTKISNKSRVKELSKGMVTQLHLALIMAIDTKLLVLDEPTLGLDIIYRKRFYDTLLNDYYDENRTIIITTHQVEEIEHILTDVMFINDGEIILNQSIESIANSFSQIDVNATQEETAIALQPINVKRTMNGKTMLFENVNKGELSKLGDMKIPSLADIFVAKIEPLVEKISTTKRGFNDE